MAMTATKGKRKKPQPRRTRILAVASGGGHWVQLLRLRPAFAGDRHHPGTSDQADRLIPLLHEVWQQHDVELDGGVLEHAAPGSLEGSDGHRVGHLALGAEDAAEVVLHHDPSGRPFFEFCLEEHHGAAARIGGILGVGVPEEEYAVIADRRRRPRDQGRDEGNQYVTNQGITSPFGALTRSSPAMSSQE